jgi:toxin secretion/phage lysis holin
MNWVNWLKAAVAAVGGVLTWLFGGWAMFVAVVLGLMVIDYVTGLIAAKVTKTLSSKVGFNGILKKLAIMIVIVMAALLDYALRQYVNPELALCLGIVCFFYAFNESLSILENLGRAGVPYPEKLKEVILVLNKKAEPPLPDVLVPENRAALPRKDLSENDDHGVSTGE